MSKLCTVFPAHAGVFPLYIVRAVSMLRIPRSRGGVSHPYLNRASLIAYSPLTRGCFCATLPASRKSSVFPAHAGVFLYLYGYRCQGVCIPRSRGGVSLYLPQETGRVGYSPLTRGCFWRGCLVDGWRAVFPAHAGVFLSWSAARA